MAIRELNHIAQPMADKPANVHRVDVSPGLRMH